jgi:hypothetical protein
VDRVAGETIIADQAISLRHEPRTRQLPRLVLPDENVSRYDVTATDTLPPVPDESVLPLMSPSSAIESCPAFTVM